MRTTRKNSTRDLAIVGFDAARSHAITEGLVRIYFRLSAPPPLGWSYMFTMIWNAISYPSKCPAGVEGESIWIDCAPEEVETYHLAELQGAVAQTNATYRQRVQQQLLNKRQQAELQAQLRARLHELNRTLYPEVEEIGSSTSRRARSGKLFSGLRQCLGFPKARKSTA